MASELRRMILSRDVQRGKSRRKSRLLKNARNTISRYLGKMGTDQAERQERERREAAHALELQASALRLQITEDELERMKQAFEKLEREVQRQQEDVLETEELHRQLDEYEDQSERLREKNEELQEQCDSKDEEIRRLREALESLESAGQAVRQLEPDDEALRAQAVLITLVGKIPFRSLPRVLETLVQTGSLPQQWIMHFSSLPNWFVRYGISCLEQVDLQDEPWIMIIDSTMEVGPGKLLTAIRVPAMIRSGDGAPTLNDAQVIGCRIVQSCSGEDVRKFIEDVISQSGRPCAILKDAGWDLEKGRHLYNERHTGQEPIPALADIGHVVANALKKEFGGLQSFKRFTTIAHGGGKRLRQTAGASYCPPAQRAKGRFQSISKLTGWAMKVLEEMAQPGRVTFDSKLAALRKAFPKLTQLKPFVVRLHCAAETLNEIQSILKNEGLSRKTHRQCRGLLCQLPKHSHSRLAIEAWLDQHLTLQKALLPESEGMLVSTDIIESLFGRYKAILERSPSKDLNRLIYMLPAFCGQHSAQSIIEGLRRVSHAQAMRVVVKMVPPTQRQQLYNLRKLPHGSGQKLASVQMVA